MKRVAEAFIFALLAILVHVALFVARPDAGTEAGGAGGEALVSIEAAAPTVVEMVEAWEEQAQPVTQTDLAMDQPTVPDDTPPPPSIELAEAPNAELQVARIATPDRETLELQIEELKRNPLQTQPQLDTPTPQAPPMQTTPDLTAPEVDRPELAQAQLAAMQLPQTDPVIVDTTPVEPTVSEAAPSTSPRPEARPDPVEQARAPQPAQEKPQPQNVPKAEQTTESRAGQKAAGTGGTNQAGSAQARTATISQGQLNHLKGIWGSKIRAKIERAKRYPRGENASGKVALALRVSRAGQLLGVSVRSSSGSARLDAAAVDSVKRARKFAQA
ncbi:MAG: TonB family protein, partial [Pseudomonadota bacterium]